MSQPTTTMDVDMDIEQDDEILETLADGGQMNYEQWPALFDRLMIRLDRIIKEQFDVPRSSQQKLENTKQETIDDSSQSSTQSTNKENAPPSTSTLHPQLLALIESIKTTLQTLFSKHPPHTIQRLAELLLHPKEHYRTLPSYLHALDRVVHVTSGAHVFPLPPAIPDLSAVHALADGKLPSGADPLSVSWGNPTTTPQSALGSDESLGGALLTPISWLTKPSNGAHSPLEGEVRTESTEMVDGPNGPGGVETVSVSVNGISSVKDGEGVAAALRAEGGITQGELLRQEQKAGVVPAVQLQGMRGDSDGMGEMDEAPHARGPEEIGMEDMGPQTGGSTTRGGSNSGMQGIDLETALGRKIEPEGKEDEKEDRDEEMRDRSVTPKRGAEEEEGGDSKRVKDEEKKEDADGDTEIVDADGKTEEDVKTGEKGDTKGPDAADTSST